MRLPLLHASGSRDVAATELSGCAVLSVVLFLYVCEFTLRNHHTSLQMMPWKEAEPRSHTQ